MKRVIKIILWVVVVAVLAVGIYIGWRALRRGAVVAPQGGGPTGAEELILTPKALSENPVFDYWLNKSTGEIYYVAEDGQIYKITAEGESQGVGSQTIGQLSYIKPSSDGSLILIAFGYPQKPTFAIHNLSTKTWQSLPEGTVATAWDPRSNNRIAYLRDNGTTSRLNLLALSTQKSQEILRFSQKDLELDWVLPDVIYFKERPSNQVASSLWSYNLKTKVIKTVAANELGLNLKWPTDGALGLKWEANALNIIDANNKSLAVLNIKTLPNKCAFNEFRIYCSAPSDQLNVPVSVFPDNYLKKSISFIDDIYLISLLDLGRSPELLAIKIFDSFISGIGIDADHLEVQGENRLLFINRFDNRLYSLDL